MRRTPACLGLGLVLLLGGCGGGTSVESSASATDPDNSATPSATGSPTPAPSVSAPSTPAPTDSATPSASSGAGPSFAPSSSPGGLPGWASSTPNPVTINAKLVTPRPGMADLHSVSWGYAELVGARTVEVFYYAGIEPCTVLDHVDVSYSADSISISLFAGSDPSAAGMACAALARATAVDVTLDQDPAGRTFVDGSTGQASATTKPAGM